MIKMTFEMVILCCIVAACIAVAASIMLVHLWPAALVGIVAIVLYKHNHPKPTITKCPDCELQEMSKKCRQHQ